MPWKRHSIAGLTHGTGKFRVIHPFNPLFGKEYEMIERKKIWGEDRILYINENGELCLIPTLWTDIIEEDPFVTVSNGRSPFKFDDLTVLSSLIKNINETT